jgi:chorismate synthase
VPLPPFTVLATSKTVLGLAAAAEPAARSRSVVIFAGAALAALLLVIGQLIASRRITRLEEAQEQRQPFPQELEHRLQTLEAAVPDAYARPDSLGGPDVLAQPDVLGGPDVLGQPEVERLEVELAELRHKVEELRQQLREPNEIPTALAVLAPLPVEI